jgi:hypothetical protein
MTPDADALRQSYAATKMWPFASSRCTAIEAAPLWNS